MRVASENKNEGYKWMMNGRRREEDKEAIDITDMIHEG